MQMNRITNHFDKERRGEILRFAIVGVLAVAIQYGVYLLLVWLFADQAMTPSQSYYRGGFGGEYFPLLANWFAYVVSFLFNYAASTRYTFRVHSTARRGAGFTLAHLVNFLLQTVLLALFLRLGLSKPVAMLPVFAICVPVNFLLVRYFLKKGEEPTPDPSLKGRESQRDIP